MILVDDHLALASLSGALPTRLEAPCATTYGFYVRLLTAALREREAGRLGAARDPLIADLIEHPPDDLLVVVDPVRVAADTARVKAEHGANLLLAEVCAVAVADGLSVRVVPANVGRSWKPVLAALDIDFDTVEA